MEFVAVEFMAVESMSARVESNGNEKADVLYLVIGCKRESFVGDHTKGLACDDSVIYLFSIYYLFHHLVRLPSRLENLGHWR